MIKSRLFGRSVPWKIVSQFLEDNKMVSRVMGQSEVFGFPLMSKKIDLQGKFISCCSLSVNILKPP